MRRINKILLHPLYQENYKLLQKLEEERIFCGHTMEHFLDTARLCYIFNLEDQSQISKDCIYAAALLHDIGRSHQYLENTPHHIASADIAGKLLPDCGFTAAETEEISAAILDHRNSDIREKKTLSGYLYRADKMSRNCLNCRVYDQCNWPLEKKNLEIVY